MVTDYKRQCGYSVGTLKDFIYLIPYNADVFSYSIDNGMCSEVAMNSNNGIVRIDGFQTTLKNTETLDGRFKYESEVSIYIQETLGQNLFDRMRYLIQNRWYIVCEDMHGVQYIQSVEFYSEFEYNLSITDQNNAQNRIQLKFKGSSNFPTMIMGTNIVKDNTTALISGSCRYIKGGIFDFKMCENQYVLISEKNHEVSSIKTTGGYSFKGIDFMPKSFTYTQAYSNGQFEDTITFSIPLSDYKYYWHYNLIEFGDNRYVATFRTDNDNLYVVGYSDGASVSYVIETSTAVNSLNKITITLKYIGSDGLYISSKDDSIFGKDDSVVLRPAPDMVNGTFTKECNNNGTATIILVQRYTASGTPMNEYLVLEGYAERFPTLNIVGIYSLSDDLGFPLTVPHPSCVGGLCNTVSGISNPYAFSARNPKYTFEFTTSCDYKYIGIPSWLDINPTGSAFEMVLNSSVPQESTGTTFYIETSDGTRHPIIVSFTASGDTTGWDAYPREIYIDHNSQNVTANYIGDITDDNVGFSSDTLTFVSKGGGSIVVSVPANNTENVAYHFFTITNNKNGESVEIKVTQSGSVEDWRDVGGFICKDGNKYTKKELYVGGKATGVFKEGTLIETGSTDCIIEETRWIQYDTVCDGVNEYAMLKQQKSTNGGTTWTDTGLTQKGSLVEANSEKCNPDHVSWRNTGEKRCENGNMCEVWAKYIDDVANGETEGMNCVYDPTNCPTEFPIKWEITDKTQCVDRGNGICDSWYLEEEYISYDNEATWQSLGVYRVSTTMAKKDDEACNCPNHDKWRYERWVWDGKGFLCEDEEYNCKMKTIWVPYGFSYNTRYVNERHGVWTNKLITKIVAPCDFKDVFDNLNDFAKDCQQLETVEELDCINIDSITSVFENCISLKNMPLKNMRNVTHCNRAFYGCSNLKGTYNMTMPNVIYCEAMFYGSGIEGWDFGGARLAYKPKDIIGGSVLKSLKGLDFINVKEDTSYEMTWRSNYIVTLEIRNIGIDFKFNRMPNLSKASIEFMYNNAQSDKKMTWTYNSENIAKWGSLPTGKSNITWVRV